MTNCMSSYLANWVRITFIGNGSAIYLQQLESHSRNNPFISIYFILYECCGSTDTNSVKSGILLHVYLTVNDHLTCHMNANDDLHYCMNANEDYDLHMKASLSLTKWLNLHLTFLDTYRLLLTQSPLVDTWISSKIWFLNDTFCQHINKHASLVLSTTRYCLSHH